MAHEKRCLPTGFNSNLENNFLKEKFCPPPQMKLQVAAYVHGPDSWPNADQKWLILA